MVGARVVCAWQLTVTNRTNKQAEKHQATSCPRACTQRVYLGALLLFFSQNIYILLVTLLNSEWRASLEVVYCLDR